MTTVILDSELFDILEEFEFESAESAERKFWTLVGEYILKNEALPVTAESETVYAFSPPGEPLYFSIVEPGGFSQFTALEIYAE